MNKLCLLYLLLMGLSACSSGKKSDSVSLSGEIKGLGNDTIYLFGADKLYDHMDTLIVKEDKFSAKLSTDTLVATMLLFSNGTEYPLYMDKGDKIQIKGSAADLTSLEINGNTPNEELTTFFKELKGLGKPSEKALAEKAETFIYGHPSSLVSIYLLEKYFVQTPKPNFEQIKNLIERMPGELKDRPYVDALLDHIQNEEKVVIGMTAPHFHLPNATKREVSRTDFNNKYLLVHFWASWDEQSRESLAMYRRLYKQELKNKSFALLGISLDTDKKEWQSAIKTDTLKWEQVCNFSGWNTEPVQQFAIQVLPANILISPTGKIEAKDLSEEAITAKLKDIKSKEKKP